MTEGLDIRRTSRGHIVVSIAHNADPAKRDPKWLAKEKSNQPDDAKFNREYLLSWDVRAGDAYYSTFALNPKHFVRRAPGLLKGKPVHRGWDFGSLHPACCWFQVDEKYRVWVLREIMGGGIDTYQFRDLILYLSGQRDLELLTKDHREKALATINNIHRGEPPYFDGLPEYARKTPWFEDGWYVDHGGHEAMISSGLVESGARTARDILSGGGIELPYSNSTAPQDRAELMQGLMITRHDGYPGLLLDEACPLLIQGFSGGIVRDKRGGPMKDGWFDNVADALGYGVRETVPAVLPPEPVLESPEMQGQRDGYSRDEPVRRRQGFRMSF